MNDVIRRISLDLSRKNNLNISFSTQYDARARIFLISVLDNGVPYNIERSCQVYVSVLRPDGRSAAFYAERMDDGLVKYAPGSWELGVAGVVYFSLSIYDGWGKKITTSPFSIEVSPGLYYGNDINESDEKQITFDSMMSELSGIKEEELSRTEAEKQRTENENYRIQSEENRESQEILRMQNEEIRNSNEAARIQVTNELLSSIDNLLAIQEIYMNVGDINEQ